MLRRRPTPGPDPQRHNAAGIIRPRRDRRNRRDLAPLKALHTHSGTSPATRFGTLTTTYVDNEAQRLGVPLTVEVHWLPPQTVVQATGSVPFGTARWNDTNTGIHIVLYRQPITSYTRPEELPDIIADIIKDLLEDLIEPPHN